MTQFTVYPESHPDHPRSCLRPYNGPGLFVTSTGTDVGKTTVVAALAAALRQLHARVGVCKPISTGCTRLPESASTPSSAMRSLNDDDYLSSDAVQIATAAGFDSADQTLWPFTSPIRYSVPTSPALAARIERRTLDWHRIASAFDWWQENCEVLIVEGAGGWYVPLDQNDFMIADLAAALRLPVLLVTNAVLGTLNQTLLTLHAIRGRNLPVVGLVINRVPSERQRDLAISSNLIELPRLTGVPVRAVLPDLGTGPLPDPLPQSFVDAIAPFARDWWALLHPTEAS